MVEVPQGNGKDYPLGETHLTEFDTLTGNPADLPRVLWFLISLPFRLLFLLFRLLVRVISFLARRGR